MDAAAFVETLRALSRSKARPSRGGVGNLTPAQVHERWKGAYSVGTLSNWRSLVKGPPFRRVGGRVLYPLKELQAYEARKLAGLAITGD